MPHVSLKKTSRYYFAYWMSADGKLKSKSTKSTQKREAIKIAKEFEAKDKYIKAQVKTLTKRLLTNPEIFEYFPINTENSSPETLDDLVKAQHHMLEGDGMEEIEIEKRMLEDAEEFQRKQEEEQNKQIDFQNSFNISSIYKNIIESNDYNLSTATIKNWTCAVKNIQKFGTYNLLEFADDRSLINKLQVFLIKDAHMNNSTINKIFGILKSLFNKVCYKYGYENITNPFNSFNSLRETKAQINILSKEQLTTYIRKYETNKKYNVMWVFLLACYLGLRRNEILNFKSSWINTDCKTVTIPLEDGSFKIKDFESRVIPIPSDLRDYILKFKITGNYVKTIRTFETEKVKNKWKFKLHDLRKTYCSFLVYKNVNIHQIMKYMGHSNLNITLKYITEVKELIDVDEDFNI